MPPVTTAPADPRVKRYLPWVVAIALFMEQLDSTIINTAVPSMAASLGVTPLSLKAVVTSYILSLAVGIPISGSRQADTLARRFIKPRGSSVFPTPIRAALGAPTYELARAASIAP